MSFICSPLGIQTLQCLSLFFHNFVLLPLQTETTVVRMAKNSQQSPKCCFIYLHVISQFISRSYHLTNNPKSKDVSLNIIEIREMFSRVRVQNISAHERREGEW